MRRAPAWSVIFLAGFATIAAHAAEPWRPSRTWAFIVCVLEWPDKDYDAFDPRGRRDADLVELLKSRGVPADHIVYLHDSSARLAKIRASFLAHLVRGRPGDLLLMYYTGHGFRDDEGVGYFAPHDAGDSYKSCWSFPSILQDVERSFRGDRALLLADCCHSGSLFEEVSREPRRVSYAVLASSIPTEESTGNWTFTQALIDGLAGRPFVDLDHDSWVTLDELVSYSQREMDQFEDQLTDTGKTWLFPPDFRLAPVKGQREARASQAIEVLEDGEWQRARVIERNGDRVKVQWIQIGYDLPADQEWVSVRHTRPPRRSTASMHH